MRIWQYFKEEGWRYYRSWPGIWPTLAITSLSLIVYFVISDCKIQQEFVKGACGSTIAITGIMLALAVTATTFQLGTFSVAELRNFVGSEKAMKDFNIIRASAKWTINILIASFAAAILISVLSKLPPVEERYPWLLLGMSVFVIVLAISHVAFAIRAAFDLAEVKVEIAKALEEGCTLIQGESRESLRSNRFLFGRSLN